MMEIETDRPVYSNIKGKNSADKSLKKDERATRKAERKAKKAKKNSSPLTRIGNKFVKKIKKLTTIKGKKVKTNPDGSTTEVAPSNVVVTPQGEYDKVEVARALNVEPSQVTPELILKTSVATQVSNTGIANPTIVTATPNSDLAIVIPAELLETGIDGNPYLAVDLQDADLPMADVAQEEAAKQPLVKWEKIMLISGITLAVIVIGVIAYKRSSK